MDGPGGESRGGHDRGGSGRLPFARFDQEMPVRSEPFRGLRNHPPVEVESVGATVERDARLVIPGLRRHGLQRASGHIRSVHGQESNTPRILEGSAEYRSPWWICPPTLVTFRRPQLTATGSISAACSSARRAPREAMATPTAPEPQQRSTRIHCSRGQRGRRLRQARRAWRVGRSVRAPAVSPSVVRPTVPRSSSTTSPLRRRAARCGDVAQKRRDPPLSAVRKTQPSRGCIPGVHR